MRTHTPGSFVIRNGRVVAGRDPRWCLLPVSRGGSFRTVRHGELIELLKTSELPDGAYQLGADGVTRLVSVRTETRLVKATLSTTDNVAARRHSRQGARRSLNSTSTHSWSGMNMRCRR
jgi:hypothetical protein